MEREQAVGHQVEPCGPPKGSSARYRVRVEAEGVRRPRLRGPNRGARRELESRPALPSAPALDSSTS